LDLSLEIQNIGLVLQLLSTQSCLLNLINLALLLRLIELHLGHSFQMLLQGNETSLES
jgi:hypothetical protein